jgi:hypothetical protein
VPEAVGDDANDPGRARGHTRKETEGVFLYQDTKAVFTPLKTGVAGEQYFELSGRG